MGNCMTLPEMFNVKRMICIDNTGSKQDSKRMAIIQEGTTATTADTTLVVDYTTINREREFHNEETCTYWLPKDEEEQQRLTGVNDCYIVWQNKCDDLCFM